MKNPPQIDLEQGREVRWIQTVRFAEGGENVLRDKRRFCTQAQLIRRRNDNNAAGTYKINHTPHELTRILHVFDDLYRYGGIEGSAFKLPCLRFKISPHKGRIVRETVILNDIRADVSSLKLRSQKLSQTTGSTTHINQPSVSQLRLQELRCRSFRRIAAPTTAKPGASGSVGMANLVSLSECRHSPTIHKVKPSFVCPASPSSHTA